MNDFRCDWFNPCPICRKCMNVADTLYERCQKCGFSQIKCNHTEKQRALMIRRQNFKLTLPKDVLEDIKELEKQSASNLHTKP